MRKLLLISTLTLTLAACGNNEDERVEEEVEETTEEVEETEDKTEEVEETEEENNESEDQASNSNTTLSDYEESELLEEHISLDELTPQVETDNQNKRIILFENDENEKVYKSIFIKNDEHLKIIDISDNGNDGLIYEGRL